MAVFHLLLDINCINNEGLKNKSGLTPKNKAPQSSKVNFRLIGHFLEAFHTFLTTMECLLAKLQKKKKKKKKTFKMKLNYNL